MAAGDLVIFPKFLANQQSGLYLTDFHNASMSINVMLVSTLTAADIAAAGYLSGFAVGSTQVTGTGYTAGGNSLSAITLTVSASSPIFMAGNTTWAQDPAGFTNARWALLYHPTGSDATAWLLAYLDLGSDRGNVSGPFTIQWNSGGIVKWTAS